MRADSIRYTSNDASATKSEESDAKEEQKQSGESQASQSEQALPGSGGSSTQSDDGKAAASSSLVNNQVQPLKQIDVDSDASAADCAQPDRLAKREPTMTAKTGPVAAAAATPPHLQQPSMECGTNNAPPAKHKQMAKRTKSAVASSSQPKKGAAKKADAAASSTKSVRAAKNPASESGGDVMTAVIDKRKHHGKWRWKVQWKSGTMVSSDNRRAG